MVVVVIFPLYTSMEALRSTGANPSAYREKGRGIQSWLGRKLEYPQETCKLEKKVPWSNQESGTKPWCCLSVYYDYIDSDLGNLGSNYQITSFTSLGTNY